MSITLYTAPDCMRCKIVKSYLADNGIEYDTIDFKGDADAFNAFYRANRKHICRNPEGVEFPLFQDGEVIRQGSGEVIAWLLGGSEMGACVTRSDFLHGKISGLYPSMCPNSQDDNFVTLVQRLAAGGLDVWLQSDGTKPGLLKKLLEIKGVHGILNVIGGPDMTEKVFGHAPSVEDMAATVDSILASGDGVLRFLAVPLPKDEGWVWPDKTDAAQAAKMIDDACHKPTLPFRIEALPKEMFWDRHGLEPITEEQLIALRNGARKYLFKAEISKADV